MQNRLTLAIAICAIAASTVSPTLMAGQSIRCESRNFQYNMCYTDTHGYVTLTRQISKTRCQQGRNWDYDRRGIWVDDGCSAEFEVESRHHTEHHSSHSGENAVAAAAAIALIAAAASAANNNKHDDRYHDDNYHHGGHSSYIPRWMQGRFKGYNLQYGASVSLEIDGDGRVDANVQGQRLKGYVNDSRLYIGDAEFDIERAGDGFNSVQRGNRSNQVHYSRVD